MSINWVSEDVALTQLELLLKTYPISCVKIGLVKSLDVCIKLVDVILAKNSAAKIIWDPVLSASAGFTFHDNINADLLNKLLDRIYMITPNWEEVLQLLPNEKEALLAAKALSKHTNVYLKGGHNTEDVGKDYLFTPNEKTYPFNAKLKRTAYAKHGSGCVLSSAIASNLTLGYPMLRACLKAKQYTTRLLESNAGLLGFHRA